ncbi:hypothetical protein EN925_20040 [Mesorhizobium sp. M7A.F.Ca.US.006.04.2.1]|nr:MULTISPECIES: hypothetical protein [unclassified Mesorhizobium]RVA88229.1 hypothetical protein EN925_20040 [Mesorhizobium sp. M7A.F.Ca.US.006.04.2.1]RUX77265.1 hypothetical protein EN990_06900 [Mesorhizobium sp. M7A.F.Ca.US.005.03.1.1]RUY24720.1 hypothetical protein EN979_25195 [Mesorhizobium sp. M7A.F.Ca.US.001.04.2.1]RUY40753.1 hypothetical protein EN978_17420 [Mesorhizobium sp. M7A.F.Ca.US.001.04.1.1]RVA00306.1 hypothetical protein EN938_25965 [Mesorhizobium sp. M7A.F.Ca.US.001.02.1.1]
MTDMPTPITTRRLNLSKPSFAWLQIGASLAAMSGFVGDALKMAFVDPYTSLRRQPEVVPEDDLEGRDPTW